tara:strand:- start:249 stop:614 length:366 start_codon:yes stop_codon:yes gene_type:complete
MQERDYYEVLGIEETASPDDIINAYRKLAKEYHPDLNPSPESTEQFKEIGEAYSVLSDPSERRRYDFNRSELRVSSLSTLESLFGGLDALMKAMEGRGENVVKRRIIIVNGMIVEEEIEVE